MVEAPVPKTYATPPAFCEQKREEKEKREEERNRQRREKRRKEDNVRLSAGSLTNLSEIKKKV